MADNPPLTQGDGSAGSVAMRNKALPGGGTGLVHRIMLTAGSACAFKTNENVDTTGELLIAASADRVSAEIEPLDADIYIADTLARLATDATRRKVLVGSVWSTTTYGGDLFARAVTGTANVATEQVT